MAIRDLLVRTTAALSLGSVLTGTAEAQVKEVVYDHLKDSANRAFELRLSDGEPFNIVIDNSCEDEFTQVEEHARGTVDAMARHERGPNQAKQPCVLLSPIRDWL